eukprot:763646-Hanusia_phi.AAC.1
MSDQPSQLSRSLISLPLAFSDLDHELPGPSQAQPGSLRRPGTVTGTQRVGLGRPPARPVPYGTIIMRPGPRRIVTVMYGIPGPGARPGIRSDSVVRNLKRLPRAELICRTSTVGHHHPSGHGRMMRLFTDTGRLVIMGHPSPCVMRPRRRIIECSERSAA